MEDAMRRALRDTALTLEPRPWPGPTVRQRARRRQRRLRGLAVLAPLAAAAAVAAIGLLPADRHSPVLPAPAVASSALPTTSATPSSPLVVASGRRVDLGHGVWLTLTTRQVCYGVGSGAPVCNAVVPGLTAQSDPTGTLYMPLYVGAGTPSRITVRVGQVTYPARVVTLPGNPGYVLAYVWTPVPSGSGLPVTVTDYDGLGRALATMSPVP